MKCIQNYKKIRKNKSIKRQAKRKPEIIPQKLGHGIMRYAGIKANLVKMRQNIHWYKLSYKLI